MAWKREMASIVDEVKEILFKGDGTSVYAVLDGASVPGLLDRLYGQKRPEFECLYQGELTPDLAEVSPYLVRLERDSEITQWVLGEGWGKHWGVFVLAAADLLSLRKHLRRFLIVHDSDRKPLYFRYYDPRVLRTYLPTCNEKELPEFLGPIDAFVLEGAGPGMLLRFRNENGKLGKHEQRLRTE